MTMMLLKLIYDAVTIEKMRDKEDSKHRGPEAWCTARVQQGSRIPVESKRGGQ